MSGQQHLAWEPYNPGPLVIDESSDGSICSSNETDNFNIAIPDWVDKSLSDVLCCNY